MNAKVFFITLFIATFSIVTFGQCEKYVQVVDRLTLKPIAYADISRYDFPTISNDGFDALAFTGNSNGVVKLSICPDHSYKVNANKEGIILQ